MMLNGPAPVAPAAAPANPPDAPIELSGLIITRLNALLGSGLRNPNAAERASLLLGLARLRDPSLEPLFSLLASTGLAADRADATIALAAINPRRGLDLLLLRHLPSDDYRYRVLMSCLQQELIAREQLLDLSLWPDLGDRSTVLAAAFLAGQALPPAVALAQTPVAPASSSSGAPAIPPAIFAPRTSGNTVRLRELSALTQPGDFAMSMAAAAVLAQQGEQTALMRLGRALPRLAMPEGESAAFGVLELISRARLDGLGEWCMVLASQPGISTQLARAAEAAAVVSGASGNAIRQIALAMAERAIAQAEAGDGAAAAESAAELLRWARHAPERLSTPQWQVLSARAGKIGTASAAMIQASIAAVVALTQGSADAPSKVAGLPAAFATYRQQPLIAAWAVAWSSGQPAQAAQQVRMELLRVVLSAPTAELGEAAREAARLLMDSEPAETVALVVKAHGDLAAQREGDVAADNAALAEQQRSLRRTIATVLLGALASTNLQAGIAVQAIGPLLPAGDVLTDVLLLVQARHGGNRPAIDSVGLPAAEQGGAAQPLQTPAPGQSLAERQAAATRLAGLALGDGTFSAPVRMQAAWLAIRAAGQERPTLARLLRPSGPEPSTPRVPGTPALTR